MRISVLSEIFGGAVTHFINNWAHLFPSFRAELLIEKAVQYEESIVEEVSQLPRCVGFIDCARIQMSRPVGPGVTQRPC